MAANRIKGITIEIGGDTTKLQTGRNIAKIVMFRNVGNEYEEYPLRNTDNGIEWKIR